MYERAAKGKVKINSGLVTWEHGCRSISTPDTFTHTHNVKVQHRTDFVQTKNKLLTLCKMLYFSFKEIALKNEDYTLHLLRININILMHVWFVLF